MYQLREAAFRDIQQIKRLFRETVHNVNRKDYSLKQIKAWTALGEDDRIWKECIAGQYFIVAVKEQEILGFSALKRNGEINSMFTHRLHQGKGIASALLTDMELRARMWRCPRITADVTITARSFFERKGYMTINRKIVNLGIDLVNYSMMKVL